MLGSVSAWDNGLLGGMYKGVFTPVEAGGFGAVGAVLIGICLRRYTWKRFTSALYGAAVVVSATPIATPATESAVLRR